MIGTLTHWPLGNAALNLVIFKLVLKIDILRISFEIALKPQDLTDD